MQSNAEKPSLCQTAVHKSRAGGSGQTAGSVSPPYRRKIAAPLTLSSTRPTQPVITRPTARRRGHTRRILKDRKFTAEVQAAQEAVCSTERSCATNKGNTFGCIQSRESGGGYLKQPQLDSLPLLPNSIRGQINYDCWQGHTTNNFQE